ncbi:MAG: 2OG-Fe(II) oxygenase, partial [Rhizobacter sp.]|nr:2OG-Fe(II) oxygenase [Rhizobacter sp.]
MSRVPLVDIAPFLHGTLAERDAVAASVDAACRDSGFLMVAGHGVPPELMGRYEAHLTAFFALPLEIKQAIGVTRDSNRGYRGRDATALAHSRGDYTPPDLMERFTTGRTDIPDDDYHRARAHNHFQPNRFPSDAAFVDTAIAYYAEMERLASDMLRVFARALELPEGWFAPFCDRHISHLVANYYPAQSQAAASGQFRAGAHTDFGALTLLHPARSPRGLQVQAAGGGWEDVVHVPGTFIVNLGDLMARWTNDRWVSTMHRVVPAKMLFKQRMGTRVRVPKGFEDSFQIGLAHIEGGR